MSPRFLYIFSVGRNFDTGVPELDTFMPVDNEELLKETAVCALEGGDYKTPLLNQVQSHVGQMQMRCRYGSTKLCKFGCDEAFSRTEFEAMIGTWTMEKIMSFEYK